MAKLPDPKSAVHLLQELIRLDSTNPPGNEHRVAQWLAGHLERKGLPVKVTPVEEGRSNLEVRIGSGGGKKLLFCGHMDTVSPGSTDRWTYPPFSGEIAGNRLYGRGASDMKSGLAAMVLSLESLANEEESLKGEWILTATAGEEVDSCGARQYKELGGMKGVNALVIGEPTKEKVVVGHKGALWLEITTYGRTAHSSMPARGINAVDHMLRVAEWLQSLGLSWEMKDPVLGSGSLSFTRIDGGIQTNVIPDRCRLQVDIRTVPPREHSVLIRETEKRLSEGAEKVEGFRYQIRTLLDRPSIRTPAADPLIRLAQELKGPHENQVHGVSYYTDGSVLNPNSEIPTLIYGPGDEALAHQPDEWVDIGAYLRSITFYRELVLRYLGSDTSIR
ncbi:M20 family metallopeptidase [Paludifilum halophilum]|uniref:Probable succinyl-diaminopimelate desuccinylase n=1 Tax=Paludifilum halophilum TaxID=1642702 RepID=A0A235BB40_9BACL|nr:M20 family metallopeptidase [Paludifilum halophilum]OYD09097.1 acetylornithine deacetylase [Paludifilum halophilum]